MSHCLLLFISSSEISESLSDQSDSSSSSPSGSRVASPSLKTASQSTLPFSSSGVLSAGQYSVLRGDEARLRRNDKSLYLISYCSWCSCQMSPSLYFSTRDISAPALSGWAWIKNFWCSPVMFLLILFSSGSRNL